MKNAKKSLFISEKMKKYRKCPALITSFIRAVYMLARGPPIIVLFFSFSRCLVSPQGQYTHPAVKDGCDFLCFVVQTTRSRFSIRFGSVPSRSLLSLRDEFGAN